MSRTIATVKRPEPHKPEPDPLDPLTCARCQLLTTNGVHSTAEIDRVAAEQAAQDARIHAAQEAHRQRFGEH